MNLIGLIALMLGLLCLGIFAGWQMRGTNAAPPRVWFTAATPTPAPSANTDGAEQARETVIERFKSAVVQINITTDQGTSLGSGVIIDERGYIITNNHVVANSKSIQVVLTNGDKQAASLTGTSALDDLAVVKIDPAQSKLTVAQLGDSSSLKVGQNVLAIGNPLGITQTVTSGIISALDRNVIDDKGQTMPGAIQTDAPINPGNSGGALINLQGQLVGIPTSVPIDPEFKTPASGVGFAIPVNRVKFIAPQLIESGHVTNTGRAVLGIDATSVDPVLAQQNSLPVDRGVLIANITAGGPADKAGLKNGDVIVKIDNTKIDDTPSLADVLLSKKPGDTVSVQYYRGGQQSSASVTLGERPAS
jgi:S1-C subfamily serine protease